MKQIKFNYLPIIIYQSIYNIVTIIIYNNIVYYFKYSRKNLNESSIKL